MTSVLIDPNDLVGSLQRIADRLDALETTGIIPVGLVAYCAGAVPNGWLYADGSAFDGNRYGQLKAYLASTTLPNIDGRVIVCKGSGTFATLGATGGAETHTLSLAEMPAHSHTITDASVLTASGTSTWDIANAGGGRPSRLFQPVTDSKGSSSAHNNLQPYIVLLAIIKF